MRTRRPGLIALIPLTALVVAACAPWPAPTGGSQGPAAEASGATGVLPTPVPTTPPATPPASAVAVLAADVLEANTTSWPVKSVSAGSSICAIGLDDGLLCWGGALQDRAPDGKYAAVDAGPDDSCAIRLDATLVCWGQFAEEPPKGEFVALDSGQQERCGLRTDGSLACWFIDFGDVVPADEQPRMQIPDGPFTQLVMSDAEHCALREAGTISCWMTGEPPREVPGGPYVSLGEGCAVRTTGELECFVQSDLPAAPLPDGPFVAMSGTPHVGCALRASGELTCWGTQGFDRATDVELPMRTPPGTYTAVSVNQYRACAIGTGHRVVCWGDDDAALRPGPSADVKAPPLAEAPAVEVTWRGSPVLAPIISFDVEYFLRDWGPGGFPEARGQDPNWTPWLAGTTDTSATLIASEGGTLCFRARAHDADGLIGSWYEGACTTVPVDDRELTPAENWTAVEGDAYFLGTALRSTTKGAVIRITNGGPGSIGILATRCGGCGTFVVRSIGYDCEDDSGQPMASCPPVDEEVDLKGARSDSEVVFRSDNGEQGFEGPIDIVVTSSGKPVIIDAVLFNLEAE